MISRWGTHSDRALWSRMRSFKDHGKSWDAVYERQHPPGFRWACDTISTNWRMLEMQATIGRTQLRHLSDWTATRAANAARLRAALAPFGEADGIARVPGLTEAERQAGSVHAQYKFYAYARPERLAPGWDRDRIVTEFNTAGVPCYQGSCSKVYLEKAFEQSIHRPAQRLPVARQLGDTSVMWLLHPTLTDAEIAQTADVITQIFTAAAVR